MNELQQKLLTYLGSCLFETKESPRLIPPQEEMTELFNLAENFALDQFLLYYYKEYLPKELLQRARINYLTFAGEDVKHLRTLKEVERVLTEHSIDYCLLKGSYLIKDIYPESALRFRVDVDLLVRENEGKKAFKILEESGWGAKHGFIEVINSHLPAMYRKGFSTIEIHLHLFDKDDSNENQKLWQIIDNGNQDEMLLAHILKHAFISHDFENGLKTLFDIGYLLKTHDIDFEKLAKLEQELYNFEFMPLVINSFKEFFPKEIQAKCKPADPKLSKALRAIIFQDITWDDKEKSSLKMQKILGGQGVFRRGLKLFSDLSPARISSRFLVKNTKLIYLLYPYYVTKVVLVYIRYSYIFLSQKQNRDITNNKAKFIKNIAILKEHYKK